MTQRSGNKDAEIRELKREVRQYQGELNALWESRFYELRILEDGSKKLWPTTEEAVGRAIDMQDCYGKAPDFMYCDHDGTLHPVSVGKQILHKPDPQCPDESPLVFASADLIANGRCVGRVSFSDH